jgi:hypothetical protein
VVKKGILGAAALSILLLFLALVFGLAFYKGRRRAAEHSQQQYGNNAYRDAPR